MKRFGACMSALDATTWKKNKGPQSCGHSVHLQLLDYQCPLGTLKSGEEKLKLVEDKINININI